MIDPRNSRRIRPDLRTHSQDIKNIVRDLYFKFLKWRLSNASRRVSRSDYPKIFRNLELTVLNLFAAWIDDPQKSVGYSRGQRNFTRGGSYWDHHKDQSLISKTIIFRLFSFLKEEGYIENLIAESGRNPYSSRMMALPKLTRYWKKRPVSWASIGFDPAVSAIVMKDKKKRSIPLPDDPDFDLELAEANLRRINKNLLSTFINLNITDETLYEIRQRNLRRDELDDDPSNCREFREPFEFTNRRLRRVFANGTYNDGGRFYGGWWQGMPSEYRKFIEIEGAVTVELDYATIQPRILYARAKTEPPDDSYTVDGWSTELRPTIKKAFNQLVNCRKKTRKPNQWYKLAPELDHDPLPENWGNLKKHQKRKLQRAAFEQLTGRTYDQLLSDLLKMHEPINDFFFSRSWTWLQRVDSDIAEKVMLRLLKIPLTVLPIHDSFIVRRGEEGALRKTMKEAFWEVVGTEPKIDRNDDLFLSPFEPAPGVPQEKRLIWGKDLISEARNHLFECSCYHQRETDWQRVHGPL